MFTSDTIGEAVPDVFGAAIKGTRSDQQDSFGKRWIDKDASWLLVLADGMGGHAGGATASNIAVDGFAASFVSCRSRGFSLEDSLRRSLADVNERIAQTQSLRPDLAGMGTTLLGAHVSRHGISWISVGDSPMWLMRDGALKRLNEDHSLREEASVKSHFLQSAVNGAAIPMIDCHAEPVSLQPDDVLLMASDGIFTLGEPEMVAAMQPNQTHRRAHDLVNNLLDRVSKKNSRRQDNCSVVVARGFAGEPLASGDRARPSWLPVSWAWIVLSALGGVSAITELFLAR